MLTEHPLSQAWQGAPWAAPAFPNSSSQRWGSTESSLLDPYTPTENRTAAEKMPWTLVIRAWPAKLTDWQLACMGLVTFLTFLVCILNEIHPAHAFTSLPFSCLLAVTPAFPCIAPGFAKSLVKCLKVTMVVWTLHWVTDAVSWTVLALQGCSHPRGPDSSPSELCDVWHLLMYPS